MAKWLYADGKLYNTDCFQKIELCLKSNPRMWVIRAFYVNSEAYVDLYTGDQDDAIQAQIRLSRWLQAPDLDYF